MANVDLETGKVYGAKEGTKTYGHELAHLRFEDEAPAGNITRQIQDISFKSIVFFTALYILYQFWITRIVVIFALIFSIASEIYEELWCWNNAKKEVNHDGLKETLQLQKI